VASLRVAVLAALNLADELAQSATADPRAGHTHSPKSGEWMGHTGLVFLERSSTHQFTPETQNARLGWGTQSSGLAGSLSQV
jgi:hypothetical protein